MKNNRFHHCFNYKFRSLGVATLFFLAVYAVIRFVLPLVVSLMADSSMQITFNSDLFGDGARSLFSASFMISAMIFFFVGGVASFREEFNHLLAMNNTRINVFGSGTLAQLSILALMSVGNVILGIVEFLFDNWLDGRSPVTAFQNALMQDGFNTVITAALTSLLLAFAMFLAAYTFGETVGILAYRIGRIFVAPFWICFGLAFVVVPIAASGNSRFANFFDWYFGLNTANPFLTTALHLLISAVVFKLISLLAIRKTPQAA